MKMLVLVCVSAIAISVLVEGKAHADLIYNVDRTIVAGGGVGSVFGTIETDGTLGVLDSANVVDWTLTVGIDLFSPPTFTLFGPLSGSSNSALVVVGSSFTATPTDLLFDFSNTINDIIGFRNPSSGSAANAWCIRGANDVSINDSIACGFVPAGRESILHFSIAIDPLISGVQSVGTRDVPEPATLALFGAGLVGLVSIRYRRKAKAPAPGENVH